MSDTMEIESGSSPKSTGNHIDLKVTVKSQSKDGSNQGKGQFELDDPQSRYSYFLANLADDELSYLDCPPKTSPLKGSSESKSVEDETADSPSAYDRYDKQDKSDKSNVFHKNIDGCCCNFDTDDEEFNFILGNEFDTDDDDMDF